MDAQTIGSSTLRALAIDGVEAANSGHPGMPLGMADVVTVLWSQFLKHDPSQPKWPDRDRFVMSGGHGSMLLYGLLHLSGYALSLDDLKNFRQWGSKTPGHPEYGHTVGVETTTGPLGQGVANAVGMAIVERWLRDNYGADLCDHHTYAVCGDGDLMEGVASEAASLAGHLGLGRLVLLYDDNHISIDGDTALAFTEDRAMRFRAYGWHVQEIDGHDLVAIAAAITAARAVADKPSLICCRTTIGKGSKNQGSEKTHGAPLGKEDVANVKRGLGFDPDASFAVSAEACAVFRNHDGQARRLAWEQRFAAHPRKAEFATTLAADGAALAAKVSWPAFKAGDKIATRKASQTCLQAVIEQAPWVIGGSADLAGSNGTETKKPLFSPTSFKGAQTFAFGVREHGMAAVCNGMTLHGGALPYCATFLVFHDYMRPSVRLSCLMGIPVIYIYTHDSIFLGEDGPTHQPVEHLAALRTIPGMRTFRPADATETAIGWQVALARKDGPTALVLTRQNLPVIDRTALAPAEGALRGGYVLQEAIGPVRVVLVATGSEVPLALDAAKLLGDGVRVVSMPCVDLFVQQNAAYRASVLPKGVRRVSIEAGITLGWERIVGDDGLSIGIDRFGASAPDKVLAEKFGFTPAAVAERVRAHLA